MNCDKCIFTCTFLTIITLDEKEDIEWEEDNEEEI